MKRSVGAEREGEGSPTRRRTDPIIRESAKDFILFLFASKSDIALDWWSSCKCAHEHWHLRLRPRFYIPIHHYAAPYASFNEWRPTPSLPLISSSELRPGSVSASKGALYQLIQSMAERHSEKFDMQNIA